MLALDYLAQLMDTGLIKGAQPNRHMVGFKELVGWGEGEPSSTES